MVILHMVGCQRTWAEMEIVQMEKGSVRLVMFDDQLCVCRASQAETETELESVVWNVTVAWNEDLCQKICAGMRSLSTIQDKQTPVSTFLFPN